MIAYRVWNLLRVFREEFRLTSFGGVDTWEVIWEKEMTAVCTVRAGLVRDHLTDVLLKSKFLPGVSTMIQDCKCGLYAFKSIAQASRAAEWKELTGTVNLFGTVLETEFGYRATNALVDSIFERRYSCMYCRKPGRWVVPWVGLRGRHYPTDRQVLEFFCDDHLIEHKNDIVISEKVELSEVYRLLSSYYGVPIIFHKDWTALRREGRLG